MNILEQAKKIPHGIAVITEWLGSGGIVVSPEESQARADICNGNTPSGHRCPHNVTNPTVTKAVALAVKKYLSVKNAVNLRVRGEKALGTCDICSCVLRLQVHEPQEKVRRDLTDEEKDLLPKFCWKLK